MLSNFDTKIIDNFLKEKFPLIYEYKFDGLVLLYGGAIRSLIMNETIRDLDIVVLSQKKCDIEKFLRTYNISYTYNTFNGYKINYNDIEIDITTTDDLFDVITYDTDGLFYDVEYKMLIPFGAIYSYSNYKITELNSDKKPTIGDKKRLKGLEKFVKFINHSNKKVKVRKKWIKWHYKMFIQKIKYFKNKITKGNFRKCFRFLKNSKKEFIYIIILGCLVSLISAIIPSLSGNLVVKLLSGGYKSVLYIIIFIVSAKVLTILFSFYLSKLYLTIRKNMVFNIRKELSNHILNFEMSNFSNNNSGTFINKIKDDPDEITRTFNKMKDIFVSGVGNIGILIYIFILSYQIGLVLLVFMIIIYKIQMIGIKKKIIARKKMLLEQEKYSSMLKEMISGMSDIKALDIKGEYINKTSKSFENASNLEYEGDYYQNFYNKIAKLVEFFAFGVVILFGVFLVKKNILLSSSLVIIFMYRTDVFNFLNKITSLMDLRASFNLSCSRIFSIIENNGYTKEKYGEKRLNNCHGKIEFKEVNFKYSDRYILKNCSFKINNYETVGILGKSGSGKTTILNLIFKMYSVSSGEILIDDINVNDIVETDLKNNISIISQNPYLFDMSIKENMKLVKEDITDKELEKVFKKVCLYDYVKSLPKGFDTTIGEGGLQLSGGQKQRLAIARALIKNTKIILLDEITSALDNETGSLIKKVIDNIKKDHTIIIVTHEISMIEACDRVLVLDGGKINFDGNLKDVLNNKKFNKLYKLK